MYLLFILLFAAAAAVVQTIEHHYPDSVFVNWGRFFAPSHPQRWRPNAVTLCNVLSIAFIVATALVSKLTWWQINGLNWGWQILLGVVLCYLTHTILARWVLVRKRKT